MLIKNSHVLCNSDSFNKHLLSIPGGPATTVPESMSTKRTKLLFFFLRI